MMALRNPHDENHVSFTAFGQGGTLRNRMLELWKPFWKIKSRFAKAGMEVGCRLPDFSLKDLDEKPHTLWGLFPQKGAVLWLTNLCEGCQEKIPFLERLHHQYKDRIEILAISILGKDSKTPREIYERFHFHFPLLLDPEDWVGRVLQFPHPENTCPLFNLLILDSNGLMTLRSHLSAIKEEAVEAQIQMIAA